MKKNVIILATTSALLVLSAFKATNAENASSNRETRSVAWYVANIKEARAKNQQCHDNADLQSSEDCVNALHALEITFKGGN